MQFPSAAIDLGTNTARLLIGYVEANQTIRQVTLIRRITRLGGGFTKNDGISKDASGRSVAALKEFAEETKRHNVFNIKAVATSAVRDAVNQQEFCDLIRRETGIELEIIDGRTEGLLTLKGVLSGIDNKGGNFLVFDVGGGSTEYTLSEGEKVLFTESLPLGVVRLTEGKATYLAMDDKITRELSWLQETLKIQGIVASLDKYTLVGTAGTATTLAAISQKMTHYDYRLVNNYEISLDKIKQIYGMLLPMTPEQRLSVPGLEKGREDLIVAGTLITLKTMEVFGFTKLKISDYGLLEGILLDICDGSGSFNSPGVV
jgi:exopolyphosphatase/guanosine-5'-triphosphate,3'-diphosphate pyrophosphatase